MLSTEIEFIRTVWKGAAIKNNQHFDSIWESFLNKLQIEAEAKENFIHLENRYKECRNDLERIHVFKNAFNWISIPENYFERFQKSEIASRDFREAGNIAYKAGDLSNAFRGYNLAIAFAPDETELLGLGFSNRSVLFLNIQDPESALRDITFALKYKKYNADLTQKLQKRKLKCEDELRKSSKEQDSFEDFCNNEKQNCEEESLFRLKSDNKTIRNAESCLHVKYDPECGRRLITTKDILAGTTVLAEEPFVSSLTKSLNWDTEHCAFCTTPILGGIPCPCCTFGLYCNTTCLEAAIKTMQNYEHKLFPYLHSTDFFNDNESLLIVRILSKVGPKSLYKMFLEDHLTNYNIGNKKPSDLECNGIEFTIAGFDSSGIYDSNSYTPVYNLVSHYSSIDFNALKTTSIAEKSNKIQNPLSPPNEFKALFLTELLNELTDFFKHESIKDAGSFKDYVASIVLHHYCNLQFNILSLGEWTFPNIGPMSQPLWKERAKALGKNATNSAYAIGVFPLVALCNHSCDPNSVFVKCSRLKKAAVITSRKIRAGEEILISYKQPFSRMGFEERREYLLSNYKFVCNCYACCRGYSAKDIVTNSGDQAICNDCQCSGNVAQACARCSSKMDRVIEVGLNLENAEYLIQKEKFFQAYQIALKEANFLSDHFQPNCQLFQDTQDLIRRILVHMMHL